MGVYVTLTLPFTTQGKPARTKLGAGNSRTSLSHLENFVEERQSLV